MQVVSYLFIASSIICIFSNMAAVSVGSITLAFTNVCESPRLAAPTPSARTRPARPRVRPNPRFR